MRTYLVALCLCCFCFYSKAQIITTFAGAIMDDSGPATAVTIVPQGIAVDSAGYLYIVDRDSRIRKVSPSGTISTVVYNGEYCPATGIKLFNPSDLALDGAGNIYYTSNGARTYKINSFGYEVNLAAKNVWGFSGGAYPGDGAAATAITLNCNNIFVTQTGIIYIADYNFQRIFKVDSGIITTVAGNGSGGYSGDGAMATLAELNHPSEVAVDRFGNVYISDLINGLIRKVSTSGIITTLAGGGSSGLGDGGAATAGQLSNPQYVAVDQNGNVYVSDMGHARIRKIDTLGIITTIAGGGSSTADNILATTASIRPTFITTDLAGNIYFSDNDGRVRKVDTFGIMTTIAGRINNGYSGDGGTATLARFNQLVGIATDSSGIVYLADRLNYVVRKINVSGSISTFAGNGTNGYSGDGGAATAAQIGIPDHVAVDYSGNVYISDEYGRVRKVNTAGIISTVAGNGTIGYSGDGGPATSAGIGSVSGICVDTIYNLYIADELHHVVRKVNSSGTISTYAGNGSGSYSGDGGPATAAAIGHTNDIAADRSGNIYIADDNNNAVRKVNTSGIISTVAGTGGGWPSYLRYGIPATSVSVRPNAITVDRSNNLYISDYSTLIRKVDNSGLITNFAGYGFGGYSGEGGPALSARIGARSIAVDGLGRVYFVQSFNTVRMIDTTSDNFPTFTISPTSPTITICQNAPATSINSYFAVFDTVVGKTERWSVLYPPEHGNLDGFCESMVSTGGTITPIGLTYQPEFGYAGSDYFVIQISDGITASDIFINVTITPSPDSISGPSNICVGSSTTLGCTPSGGTWTSSNSSIASIGSATGIVASIASGVATITYTSTSGCFVTKTLSVNTTTGTITGTTGICIGATTTLTCTPTGGTWTSSNTSVATIGSGTGILSGIAAGTVNITYTIGSGCVSTATATVNMTPTAITGTAFVCIGSTTTLSSSPSGGTWSSSNSSVATVGSGTGIVSGISTGTTTITYTFGSCFTTKAVTVNTAPGVISGTLGICSGSTTTLTSSPSGGTWTSSNTAIAIVGSGTGVVSGVAAGTATITYSLGTGCFRTAVVSVDSSPAVTAGINPTVPAGSPSANLPYSLPTGGPTQYSIVYSTAALSAGFTNVTGATLPPSPIVLILPIAAPAAIYTATLTVSNGTCTSTGYPISVTLTTGGNIPPAFVGGSPQSLIACGNPTVNPINTLLSITDPDVGNTETWTVLIAPLHGSIATGGTQVATGSIVTPAGFSYSPSVGYAGTDVFTIRVSDGAGGIATTTINVTVNPLPASFTVTGGGSFCTGGTGYLVGLSGSHVGISYQLCLGGSPTGSPLPGIGGPLNFGLRTTPGVYTVIATNTVTACTKTMTGSATIIENPIPLVFDVTGGGNYCAGGGEGIPVGLSGSQLGINYRLYRGGTTTVGGTVAGTGGSISFGLQTIAGTYTVVGTSPTTTCSSNMSGSAVITVSTMPAPITVTGGGGYCTGGTGVVVGLAGSATGISYQLFQSSTPVGSPLIGIGTSLSFGPQTVAGTYTVSATNLTTGCTRGMTGVANVYVYPLPIVYTVTGGGGFCTGGYGVNIGLSGSNTGVTYKLYRSGTPVSGAIPGTGAALPFGLYTTAGTYTIIATTAVYGCTATMAGSAVVVVNPIPTITGTVFTVAPSATITLTGTPTGGTWTSSNTAVATIGSSSGVVTGVALGSATMTYTLPTGCSKTRLITVTATGHKDIPGSSPVAELTGDIKATPNPSNGTFTIKGTIAGTGDQEFRVEILSTSGQIVYTGKLTSHNHEINAVVELGNTLANGSYILKLTTSTFEKKLHIEIVR